MNDVDPGSETPTDPSIGVEITKFSMEMSSTDTVYDYTIYAEGTASDDVIKGYYSIWVYGDDGSGPQQSWEESPIDEDHSYGDHQYHEEFFGTGPEGSWSTWKWTFHSKGPIDDNNRARFEDPESYWGPITEMLLFVRCYSEDGTWDQDSEDIMKEYTGIDPSSDGDDGEPDDDKSGDDVPGNGTSEEDEGDETPGFEISLMIGAVAIVILITIRSRKDR
ncbi:MAG: hypothetical protein QCI82_09790 [Candidatus Thermoplasmatota archaeon]|nr:hypothetical protein [Candidatus Thermoplasmatota archaeon]